MFGDDIVVRTRLTPPRLPRRWLRRPRLDQLLSESADHPLTIVCAGAGYGKSSALASFAARGGWPTAWYTLSDDLDDPLVFLLHLVHALRAVAPRVGARTIDLLSHGASGGQNWNQALDALVNDLATMLDDETILVLDDYHAIDERPVLRGLTERLLDHLPSRLHLLVAARRTPQITSLPVLRARGELFEIGEADLAFTEDEIAELFASSYDQSLSTEQAHALSGDTGGWAIALQLVGQVQHGTLDREGPLANRTTSGVQRSAFNHDTLFAYLAQDVLARQPDDVQLFLLRSSVLSELRPDVCDEVLATEDSAERLQEVERRGLFLARLDGGLYRYHPLFHAFLQAEARARLPEWAALHQRAAAHYQTAGAGEQVLYHLLEIGDAATAAAVLATAAPGWLAGGRLVTLLTWINHLPSDSLAAQPELLLAGGDAARLLARFDQAQFHYVEAERIAAARGDPLGQARAVRGQALVYLDTVQPALATDLLRRAFKLLPREARAARAELLRLIAENRLNSGRADQADRLYRVADRLAEPAGVPPAEAQGSQAGVGGATVLSRHESLRPRVLLRLGRLEEARALLQEALPRDLAAAQRGRVPDANREVSLLLSLISALLGDPPASLRYAQQGLESARQLGSALAEAVAHTRAGHALQLGPTPNLAAANQHYLQAMGLADAIGVERTRVEAYVGLTLLHGFSGNLPAAQAAAREGLAIVQRSGDAWMAAMLWVALGAVGVAAGASEADDWLGEALRRYRAGKDSYGEALVRLWRAIARQREGDIEVAAREANVVFDLARMHRYEGLLTAPTLLGPRDRMMLVPPLLAARADQGRRAAAHELLLRGFPAIAADEATQIYHPGVTLRVQTFDRLRVWRGTLEVEPRDWQRKKAQQMLGLLITNRHRWLLREQICEWLWPEENQSDAETQFKVTLNALNTALEPSRPPRTTPFYIRRQGGAYRFFPTDGVWLDVVDFEDRIDAANRRLAVGGQDDQMRAHDDLLAAVSLYHGDFMGDNLYEEWSREERERLATRYLEAATRLAELLFARNQLADATRLCELILARDSCWEEAYALLMRVYARQGNRRQALATYERCVRNLRTHLDVSPMPQTTRIYEEMRS